MINESIDVSKGEEDPDYRIFSNFNQTVTITGRLSSSGMINFQNIPSNSKYGKEIKKLFIPPEGYIYAGSDFNSLEDKVIAIESEDPLKLSVFQKNIDGHSLNACIYFKDELESKGFEVDLNDPEKINSLKEKFPTYRQDGKAVTFGLNYGASPKKVASQLGISAKKGYEIYDAYWKTYNKVDAYNKSVVQFARKHKYVESPCMKLRLYTPNIGSTDVYTRAKEERIATNFATQSIGRLT